MELSERIQHSAYLTSIVETNPDYLSYLKDSQTSLRNSLKRLIQQVSDLDAAVLTDTEQFKKYIRQIKSEFSFIWSIADLNRDTDPEILSFSELGDLQSRFANASIEAALKATRASPALKNVFPLNKAEQGKTHTEEDLKLPGLFILGLGKLGGMDLNFSSDVDLIAFYDKNTFPSQQLHGATFVITRILKTLTNLLSEQTEHGFVWRVDWRLRPHASTPDLTMEVAAAEEFYHYEAQPWHRLAMIKARVIAGDLHCGKQFLKNINNFLWRRNLDYRELDEIAVLKTKIALEHPELKVERQLGNDSLDELTDFNIKLGQGGIREIEFIVNALQLIWGGRKQELRQTNTLILLETLGKHNLLTDSVMNMLTEAYTLLRKSENRLQMLDNQQIYHVPNNNDQQQNYLALMGFSSWKLFENSMRTLRHQVHAEFIQLLNKNSHTVVSNTDINTTDWKLDDKTEEIVRSWQDGFLVYGVRIDQASSVSTLQSLLLNSIEQASIDKVTAIKRIHQYFKKLPPGGQYFRLLIEYPSLIQSIISPLLLSESMSLLLNQSPHLIDRVLEDNFHTTSESETTNKEKSNFLLDTTLVLHSSNYETRLENLRRLANEELYIAGLNFQDNKITSIQYETHLTQLAEQLLSLCVQVVCEEMDIQESPVAIIGFGKLGMKRMMPKSDLDIMFLYEAPTELEFANQFANRLQTAIHAQMREGQVYELDTRLRPSGKLGSPTISLKSFEEFNLEQAKTWTHLALVPARFVAGNLHVGEKFEKIRRKIISKPRDSHQFLCDTKKMLERIQTQRIIPDTQGKFSSKLRSGGLMELEYWLYCQVILLAPKHKNLANLDWMTCVEYISQQNQSNAKMNIAQSLESLTHLQLCIRYFGYENMAMESLPAPVLSFTLDTLGISTLKKLNEKLLTATTDTKNLLGQFFIPIEDKELTNWEETSVQWESY